jgi:hypothetical protein
MGVFIPSTLDFMNNRKQGKRRMVNALRVTGVMEATTGKSQGEGGRNVSN